MTSQFRCVIHGSFGQHFDAIQAARKLFTAAGIAVLAPAGGELTDETDGFLRFEHEADEDPRLIELRYLHTMRTLGQYGFSYFVCPDGYIGKSTAYELGIAQAMNITCFFSHQLADHPAYQPHNSIWSPEDLIEHVRNHHSMPIPRKHPRHKHIHRLWQQLVIPSSVIATGAIIEYTPRRQPKSRREVLLVKTHKWGNRYSIVGGKVRRGERLHAALLREVSEETSLRGEVGVHLCTFDEIKNSGYYNAAVTHVFVDNVVSVTSRRVQLNDEAQSSLWVQPEEALASLDIEPNARKTLELYTRQMQTA